MERPSIAVIGSGNVATHMAMALDGVADVVQVMSRYITHAKALAERLNNAEAIDDIRDLNRYCDFYLIAVNDDAISPIVQSMSKVKGIVMHTSGSVKMEVLDGASDRIGVFYPLQTFSKHTEVDVSQVPMFLEASDAATLADLEKLARKISQKVYYADSAQRTVLHIAAVFGCNFFNHLLGISADILDANGYTLDVLRPLLEVTLDKAMRIGPHAAQTGPAARHDLGVIAKHIEVLDAHNSEIYRLLSESIMTETNKRNK